jgi:hypothetical protein
MSCSVTITPGAVTLEGSDENLLAMAVDCPPGGSFTWSSDNVAVATVSAKAPPDDYQANVQPVSGGTAKIAATYGGTSESVVVTVIARNFVIVFGDPGKGEHNLGKLPELAARTHEREIRAKTAAGVPSFSPADAITTAHISTVTDLVTRLNVGNVVYLAYFGHSWNENGSAGALFIGQNHAVDSNLTVGVDPPGDIRTCTAPSGLPKASFRPSAVLRLFGCRGGIWVEFHSGTNIWSAAPSRIWLRQLRRFDIH